MDTPIQILYAYYEANRLQGHEVPSGIMDKIRGKERLLKCLYETKFQSDKAYLASENNPNSLREVVLKKIQPEIPTHTLVTLDAVKGDWSFRHDDAGNVCYSKMSEIFIPNHLNQRRRYLPIPHHQFPMSVIDGEIDYVTNDEKGADCDDTLGFPRKVALFLGKGLFVEIAAKDVNNPDTKWVLLTEDVSNVDEADKWLNFDATLQPHEIEVLDGSGGVPYLERGHYQDLYLT